MKRLLLLITVSIFIASSVGAQDSEEIILLSKKTLTKKTASSDEQILNVKKNVKASTWTKRAKLYQDVYNQGLEQLQLGTGTTTLKVFYSEPLSQTELDSNDVEIYKYETINYHFENGLLRAWKRNDPIVENPLDVAMESYQKAVELTEPEKQMKLQEKLKPGMDELKSQFQNSGQSKYFLGDYDGALASFESILDMNKLPIYEGVVDTMMINFTGIVAREVGRLNKDEAMYRKAIDAYRLLTELEYGGINMYIQMTRDYYAIGDTLGAIDNLKRGLDQYPDSTMLVTLTAQAYYLMHDNEGGVEFTNSRIEATPHVAESYYWKGLLLTNHDDLSQDTIDMALVLYEKAVEVDPTNSPIWYQAGYVYYAVGANYFELEGYEDDGDLREELIVKGNDNYEKAVIKLEKAIEISEDDATIRSESLDLLKRIYYKLYGSEDDRYIKTMDRINNF
jgi:tetratricopeptide (TPR) repeat protein